MSELQILCGNDNKKGKATAKSNARAKADSPKGNDNKKGKGNNSYKCNGKSRGRLPLGTHGG